MSIAHPGLVERHPFPPNGVLREDYSGMEQKVETTTLFRLRAYINPLHPDDECYPFTLLFVCTISGVYVLPGGRG